MDNHKNLLKSASATGICTFFCILAKNYNYPFSYAKKSYDIYHCHTMLYCNNGAEPH